MVRGDSTKRELSYLIQIDCGSISGANKADKNLPVRQVEETEQRATTADSNSQCEKKRPTEPHLAAPGDHWGRAKHHLVARSFVRVANGGCATGHAI